eukprot:1145462-Rhodomonas_salina.1
MAVPAEGFSRRAVALLRGLPPPELSAALHTAPISSRARYRTPNGPHILAQYRTPHCIDHTLSHMALQLFSPYHLAA